MIYFAFVLLELSGFLLVSVSLNASIDTRNRGLGSLNENRSIIRYSEKNLGNYIYTLSNGSAPSESSLSSYTVIPAPEQVDCFGLGRTFAKTLAWFLLGKPNGTNALEVQFMLSSRKQPKRVYVTIGEQFGLEWTDFKIERRTVVIVHGFLSHGQESWIADLEEAFLRWDDVNVVIVDWSSGGNTWNYYKAAINTKIVGYRIARFLEHIVNTTINIEGSESSSWGPLHLVGHSLGAHICGFAAKEFRKRQTQWLVKRITGLDPAQPCFKNADSTVKLYKFDAPFVDIIHTNGRLLSEIGLGLPEPVGHVDFYPSGGKTQPGCATINSSYFDYLPIPQLAIRQAICSHGRSYVYLTESLLSAVRNNCTFWAHHWDLTYRSLLRISEESCDENNCTEMGINAENHPQRGTFFVATADTVPFCVNDTRITDQVKTQLVAEHRDELED